MTHESTYLSPLHPRQRLQGGPRATLPNVRSQAEYRAGRISGAPLAPRSEFAYTSLAGSIDDSGLRAGNHPLCRTRQSGRRPRHEMAP
jgi:hypothetical protein